MGTRYSSLEELRRKKALLKKEVAEMEDLLTFENAKESLSVMTKGFTDPFLKEETELDGEIKVSLDTEKIVKELSNSVKDHFLNKNAIFSLAKSGAGINVMENALKMGAVALVGNYAKKNLYGSGWKKKLIGVALIYLAPIALRFVREKLEQYEKNKATSSMEQLI
ncbi:phosphoribosyl-ATP pyrophosphatase [Chryseobacterium koreense]|uniref:phosphoribosyl-ATP pyrophosphatase n=1 Tax=Chryseobacterium koreense TaxID=232216 RepID=UPI0026E9F0F5|nr:phosphoribosyl-ATP pyrophosphatase [Chryseobacterium koreense]